MLNFIKSLIFKDKDEELFGAKRSSVWPTVRKKFLEREPFCQVCGSKENLNVHHIKPYHLYPELELDENNLITLCEGKVINCHFLFGHLLNWTSYSLTVKDDAENWRKKILDRPKK